MKIEIELDEQTVERLAELAKLRGISVEAFVQHLAESMAPPPPKRLSEEDFERLVNEASEDLDDVPPLPPDFSRADIYCDHD